MNELVCSERTLPKYGFLAMFCMSCGLSDEGLHRGASVKVKSILFIR